MTVPHPVLIRSKCRADAFTLSEHDQGQMGTGPEHEGHHRLANRLLIRVPIHGRPPPKRFFIRRKLTGYYTCKHTVQSLFALYRMPLKITGRRNHHRQQFIKSHPHIIQCQRDPARIDPGFFSFLRDQRCQKQIRLIRRKNRRNSPIAPGLHNALFPVQRVL